MQLLHTIKDMQNLRKNLTGTLGLVPTMGNLHEGHLALIKTALQAQETVIVTIYVNPTQFGPSEDFTTYPRTLDTDIEKLKSIGVTHVFLPDTQEIYPSADNTGVQVSYPALDNMLCSHSRPNFFKGVATVVTKLVLITRPTTIYLGKKDYQQYLIVKNICAELFIDTTVVGLDTVRAKDGLALSSRNSYLTDEQRDTAPSLFKVLTQAQKDIQTKPERALQTQFLSSIEEHAKLALTDYGFSIDYFSILDYQTLDSIPSGNYIIAAAVYLGSTRLIDNVKATTS